VSVRASGSLTADMEPIEVQETVDYVTIRRLQAAYADVVTRRAWPELAELFLADAPVVIDRRSIEPVRLTGPVELGEFIAMNIGQFEFFEFVILNVHLSLRHGGDPDRAAGRMFMSELRQGGGRWTTVYGLYEDRYQRVDGQWWFAERLYHSLARTSPDVHVFEIPAPAPFAEF